MLKWPDDHVYLRYQGAMIERTLLRRRKKRENMTDDAMSARAGGVPRCVS
jgi:hypothetical protein